MSIEPKLIKSFPKIELMAHFEAYLNAISLQRLCQESSQTYPESAEALFCVNDDMPWDKLGSAIGLLRTPEQIFLFCRDIAQSVTNDGVSYAEIAVTPGHWRPLCDPSMLVTLIANGFKQAAEDGLADCVVVPVIRETDNPDYIRELLRWMSYRPHPCVVGLTICADGEMGGIVDWLNHALPLVREPGYGICLDFEKCLSAERATALLEALKPHRLANAEVLAESPQTLKRLAVIAVPVLTTLSVNQAKGRYSVTEHPYRKMMAAGVPVSFCSGFPGWLPTTLSDELALAAEHGNWQKGRLEAAMHRAIDAAFCSEEQRQALTRVVHQEAGY